MGKPVVYMGSKLHVFHQVFVENIECISFNK